MKHKFVALDGLRGLAAIAVVIFHRRAWFGGDAVFGHAYLAVDFFFMLSGFVIAHAYEKRLLQQGSFWPFIRDRVIRLHPLLFAGAALGCVVLLAEIHTGREERPALLPLTLLASFVPFPAFWAEDPFQVNLPTWSLFWEILINILFALTAFRLRTGWLAGIVALSSVAMIASSVRLSGFSTGFTNAELLWGFPRVCLGFSLGILLLRVHRSGRFPRLGLQWLPPLLLLVSLTAIPMNSTFSSIYDSAIVLILYPIILLWAAQDAPFLPPLAKLSGEISYPLYVLHEPILMLTSAILTISGISMGTPGPVEGMFRIMATILVAYLFLRLYDDPIRKWLSARFKPTRQSPPSPMPVSAALPGAGNDR